MKGDQGLEIHMPSELGNIKEQRKPGRDTSQTRAPAPEQLPNPQPIAAVRR